LSTFVDALDYKPDSFIVAPRSDWHIISIGRAKKQGTQPRFCLPTCPYYLKDKDGKCGIFYECNHFVFDMHHINDGDVMFQVVFATEDHPPYDGLGWWVSEHQLVETMGRNDEGAIYPELGKRIVDGMVAKYHQLIKKDE